jgi:hypothetical protein
MIGWMRNAEHEAERRGGIAGEHPTEDVPACAVHASGRRCHEEASRLLAVILLQETLRELADVGRMAGASGLALAPLTADPRGIQGVPQTQFACRVDSAPDS